MSVISPINPELAQRLMSPDFDPCVTETRLKKLANHCQFHAGEKTHRVRFVGARRQEARGGDIRLSQRLNIPRPTAPICWVDGVESRDGVTVSGNQPITITSPLAWLSRLCKTYPTDFYEGEFFIAFKSDAYTDNIIARDLIFGTNIKRGYIDDFLEGKNFSKEELMHRTNPCNLGNGFDADLSRDYLNYLAERFKADGAGEAYLKPEDYFRKILNMRDRGMLKIPDLNKKELLLEILQQSMLPGTGVPPLMDSQGVVDRDRLEEFLRSGQPLRIRVSTLERLGLWTKDLAKRLNSRVKEVEGIAYVEYESLPSYMVEGLIEKAKKYKTLTFKGLCSDYKKKSLRKREITEVLFARKGHGPMYHLPNMVTGGFEARYSPQHFGSRNPNSEETIEQDVEASKQKFQSSYDGAKTFLHFAREVELLREGRFDPRALFIEGQVPEFSEDFAATCFAELLRLHIPVRFDYPGYAQFTWMEMLMFVRKLLGIELSRGTLESSEMPESELGALWSHMFGAYLILASSGAFYTPSVEEYEMERTAIQLLFRDFFIPSGFAKFIQLQAWHDRNQIRIPLERLRLELLVHEQRLELPKPLDQFTEEECRKFLETFAQEKEKDLKSLRKELKKKVLDLANDYYLGHSREIYSPLLKSVLDLFHPGVHNDPEQAKVGFLQRLACDREQKPFTPGVTVKSETGQIEDIQFLQFDEKALSELPKQSKEEYFVLQLSGTFASIFHGLYRDRRPPSSRSEEDDEKGVS